MNLFHKLTQSRMMVSKFLGLSCSLFLSFSSVYAWQTDHAPVKAARIAIVGGGIGGTSCAYFLKELFGDEALLDLYEPGEIGGRLATAKVNGHDYEVGGSIIHPRNLYMVDFAKKFGLHHTMPSGGQMGIYNGVDYVFTDSEYDFVTLMKLLWQYGWDVYNIYSLKETMLNNFAKIYRLQEEGRAYNTVESLLEAMDPAFINMTKSSTLSWLKNLGFEDKTIDELVMAASRANYGQSTDIHAFVGAVSIAGADSSLWSVKGGNKRVPEELLKASRATRLYRTVTRIGLSEENTYMVTSMPPNETDKARIFAEGDTINRIIIDENPKEERTQEYDIVIFATPLTSDKSSIFFDTFYDEFTFPGHYQRIVCTMVEGRLKPSTLKIPKGLFLDEILTTSPKLIYNAVGKQNPIDGKNEKDDGYFGVWKIFSPRPLTTDQINLLFRSQKSVTIVDWLAYPHYKAKQDLGDFKLMPGMYYINSIEKAASAMEMSAIGAKNVALLAYKFWKNDDEAGRKIIKEEL